MGVHACNLSTWKAEAGGSGVPGSSAHTVGPWQQLCQEAHFTEHMEELQTGTHPNVQQGSTAQESKTSGSPLKRGGVLRPCHFLDV